MLAPCTPSTGTTGHLHAKRHVAAAVIGAAHLSIALLRRLCARQLHWHEPAAHRQLRHADKGVLGEEAEPCRADAPAKARRTRVRSRPARDLLVCGSSPLWRTRAARARGRRTYRRPGRSPPGRWPASSARPAAASPSRAVAAARVGPDSQAEALAAATAVGRGCCFREGARGTSGRGRLRVCRRARAAGTNARAASKPLR